MHLVIQDHRYLGNFDPCHGIYGKWRTLEEEFVEATYFFDVTQ